MRVAALGEAYEQLDEQSGDRMEAVLFRPLQTAYGQLKRTHAEFAARSGLPGRDFPAPAQGAPEDPRARSSAPPTRSRPPMTHLRSCRTRCCRSRSATRSCAPACPARARTIAPLPAACDDFVRTLGR